MATIVVQAVDKTHPDQYMDCRQFKRGDVICVLPDDHVFSAYEMSNPAWRIFCMPALTISEASAWLAGEPGDPKVNRTLRRRAFKFDLESPVFPKAVREYVADDARKQGDCTLALALPALRALKIAKAAIADPAIIGIDAEVIG